MSNNGQMPNGYGQVPGFSQQMIPQQYTTQTNGLPNPSLVQMNPTTMQQMQMVAAQQHTPAFFQMTPQQQQQFQLQMQQQLMSGQLQQSQQQPHVVQPMQLAQPPNGQLQMPQPIPQGILQQRQQPPQQHVQNPGLSPANAPVHIGQQTDLMVSSPVSNRPIPPQQQQMPKHSSLPSSKTPSVPPTPTQAPAQQVVQHDASHKGSLPSDQRHSSLSRPSEAQVSIPVTREQYQLLLLKWNTLKSQGKTENTDSEFAAICKIIRQAGVDQKKYKARLAELETIRGNRSKSLKLSKSATDDSRQTKIAALNTQIKALQLLSHNLDLPADIHSFVVNTASKSHKNTDESINFSFNQSPIDTSNFAKRFSRAINPLFGKHISKPKSKSGDDDTREIIISNKISQRITELERLPGNIGTINTRSVDLDPSYTIPENDDDLKTKALIELKGLRQLTRQKSMRQHLVFNLATASDPVVASMNLRYTHKRPKPQSLQDLKATEKLEYKQRMERERKERLKRVTAVKTICLQAQHVLVEKHNKSQRHTLFGRTILSAHNQIEKEEQKRAERTAKQRLQALKSNDEEAYIKLLDQTKDTRITHLLSQTNSFLGSLAQRVKVQQRESSFSGRGSSRVNEEDQEEGRVDYYEIAHRIKEEVTIQPTILVGGTLKEYQLKGLQWMVSLFNNNLNGILADEMGLGKTIQSISLISYLIEVKRQPGPYLVIVPLSTLTNWTLEFEKWAPSIKKIVYKGPPQARRYHQAEIRNGDFQVLLTTYEYIIKDRPILGKIRWTHMIIDEGHRMKNANSKLSCTINQFYTSSHRLILTGTPLQNNLGELWALLNFVLPKIFNSVKTFDEWFNTPFANAGGQEKLELNEEETLLIIRRLHKVLRPFLLRRLKKDVEKDLPDKVEKVIKCKMSAVQSKLYQQVVLHNVIFVGENGSKSGVRGLNNRIMQLRKICNHPFVFEETEDMINPTHQNNDNLWRVAGKFELLDRILPKFKATGHRILIFFQMTQVMDIMEDYLRFRGLQYLRLDGGTKADERSEMLKIFNAPDSPYFAFLLSTRAGGLGLNLQTADTVIIYDTDWNPHQDLQAQDRAHRIGQTKEVRILRLITEDSVEESILSKAHAKLEIDGKVIQAGKFDQKSTNEEQEAFLRSLLEAEEARRNQKPEDDEIDDDELNDILARSEEERVVFKQIDEERQRTSPYGKDKPFDRLFSEEELPDDLKQDIAEKIEETMKPSDEVLGRGARKRERIYYDDGLTEEQWLEAMDNDDDSVENAVARKRARAERRRERQEIKLNNLAYEAGDDDDENQEDQKLLSPEIAAAGVRKRRGRKSKISVEAGNDALIPNGKLDHDTELETVKKRGRRGRKSKAQLEAESEAAIARGEDNEVEADSDIEKPPRKRLYQQSNHVLSETIAKLGNDLLDSIMANQDEDGRPRAELFMELPDRDEYDDYYQLIKKPIAVDMIRRKLDRQKYISLKALQQDVLLMSSNAMEYNEVGSTVYEDAQEIANIANGWYQTAFDTMAQIERLNSSLEPINGTLEFNTTTTNEPTKKRGRRPKSIVDNDPELFTTLNGNAENHGSADGSEANGDGKGPHKSKGRPRKDASKLENVWETENGNADGDNFDNVAIADEGNAENSMVTDEEAGRPKKKQGGIRRGAGRRKKVN